MIRPKYPLKDLVTLQQWLTKKINMMDSSTKSDEYSELNLSKAILEYIQYLVDKEIYEEKLVMQYAPPLTANPASGQTLTFYSNTSSTESVCAVCKAKDPTIKCCIHRVTY